MNMKMCACGNRVIPTNVEACPDCIKTSPSPVFPVVLWSVLTFVVAVMVGIALQV
jgi:hypothetical protein